MKPITLKRLDVYSKHGCCPVCNNEQIEFDTLDANGPWVSQHVSCTVCGASWTDNYRFHGIDRLRDGKGNDIEDGECWMPGWRLIVQNLLKKKEVLPVLLGIDEELDKMIDAVMSKGTIDDIIP